MTVFDRFLTPFWWFLRVWGVWGKWIYCIGLLDDYELNMSYLWWFGGYGERGPESGPKRVQNHDFQSSRQSSRQSCLRKNTKKRPFSGHFQTPFLTVFDGFGDFGPPCVHPWRFWSGEFIFVGTWKKLSKKVSEKVQKPTKNRFFGPFVRVFGLWGTPKMTLFWPPFFSFWRFWGFGESGDSQGTIPYIFDLAMTRFIGFGGPWKRGVKKGSKKGFQKGHFWTKMEKMRLVARPAFLSEKWLKTWF